MVPDWRAGWDKGAWRDWAREARAAVRGASGGLVDAAVSRHLLAWERFRDARCLGVYLAFGAEVDLADVIAAAWAGGKLVAAPRVGPDGVMTLHELKEDDVPERHRFGQPEPPAAAPEVPPEDLDVVLVPGLAFDERGQRLGYGRGYYDRLLPRLRPDAAAVGVAPEALVVPALPAEEHDARVTHLVTESGLRSVAGGAAGGRPLTPSPR